MPAGKCPSQTSFTCKLYHAQKQFGLINHVPCLFKAKNGYTKPSAFHSKLFVPFQWKFGMSMGSPGLDILLNRFMHNVKWTKNLALWTPQDFLKYVCPFYNIMHERVKGPRNVPEIISFTNFLIQSFFSEYVYEHTFSVPLVSEAISRNYAYIHLTTIWMLFFLNRIKKIKISAKGKVFQSTKLSE